MKHAIIFVSLFLLVVDFIHAQPDMQNIELMGELQLPESGYGNTHDLILHKNTAYVLHFNNRTSTPTVVMIDITNSGLPVIVGAYQTEEGSASSGTSLIPQKVDSTLSLYGLPTIYQTDLQYPLLYVPHGNGFDVVNISNPAQPQKVNSFRSESPGIAIKVQDTKAIFSTQDGKIAFLHLNEGNQWHEIASIQNLLWRRAWGTHIIWDGGEWAYIRLQEFSRSSSGPAGIININVNDVSNSQPQEELTFPFFVESTHNLFAKVFDSIPVIFTTSYNRGERGYEIALIDVSNPTSSVLSEPLSRQPWITELLDMGTYVIGAATEDGIAVYEKRQQPPYLALMGTVFNPDYDDNGFRFLDSQENIFVGVERQYDRNRELFKVFRLQQSSSVKRFKYYE